MWACSNTLASISTVINNEKSLGRRGENINRQQWTWWLRERWIDQQQTMMDMMFKGRMNRVVANNDGYDDQRKDEINYKHQDEVKNKNRTWKHADGLTNNGNKLGNQEEGLGLKDFDQHLD